MSLIRSKFLSSFVSSFASSFSVLASLVVPKNSLKFRLILSALVMVLVMLPIIGITLTNAFEKQLNNAINNELSAYSYSILSVAEVENKQLQMPEALLETQFNVSQSGLYALINQKSDTLWASQSLLTQPLPSHLPTPAIGQFVFSEFIFMDQPHVMYSFTANFMENEQNFIITLHIIKNKAEYLSVIQAFKQQLWLWLALLMVVFIGVQIFWLFWTLKPLTLLTKELAQVEQGKQNAVSANYPIELQQVTSQLNTLLQTEQNQRKRYRNSLADLAHSLKNPLAILQTEWDQASQKSDSDTMTTERPNQVSQQLTVINQMIEHQLKRAQSAGESAWHLGVSVSPVVEKLVNTLRKIHHDKALDFQLLIASNAIFKGDEADLMEILGNVLDNACKAAQHTIVVKVEQTKKQLIMIISDDGQGIASSQRENILQRGLRADTYQQGHGIGLAIVRDLVESYHGCLHIENSTILGGAQFTLTFNA